MLKKSSLLSLNVFFHGDEIIIRVDGQLSNSSLDKDKKCPVVLVTDFVLLKLYIEHIHQSFYHIDPLPVLNFITSKCWIVGGIERLIEKVIDRCVYCMC